MRGCTCAGLTIAGAGGIVGLALVIASALGPSGTLVVAIALSLSTAVLLALPGVRAATLACAGATAVVAGAHAAGIDLIARASAQWTRWEEALRALAPGG